MLTVGQAQKYLQIIQIQPIFIHIQEMQEPRQLQLLIIKIHNLEVEQAELQIYLNVIYVLNIQKQKILIFIGAVGVGNTERGSMTVKVEWI